MKLKLFVIFLTLSSISFAEAAKRNLCDDLIDSGSSSKEQIKKCFDDERFGQSEYYKEQEKLNKLKEEAAKSDSKVASKAVDNIEVKKFNSDELFDASYGKAFYAIRLDHYSRPTKEKRLTERNALCSFLGYEKAIQSAVSEELWEKKNGKVKVDNQGLVIDTNLLGFVSKPEIYRDEANHYTVRKYTEITCVKRKDKDLEDSKAALKAINESLEDVNEELSGANRSNQNSGTSNNGSRSAKPAKAINGYTRPDWAEDSAVIGK
ncbi:MAG: hypothetical protein Q7U04_15540 [Bacteriovorax sp.]|nr:hypothetical protein [Bacteriovorax sp.]